MTDRLVIILHGVGAHGASLGWIADHLSPHLPGVGFAAPDAPFPFDQSPGGPARQWFSVTGVTAQNRAERIIAARLDFDATITRIMADHGLTGRPDRVAFLGFSQGSIMGLDAVATGRWPIGALVAFSGRLATPAPLTPAPTPILIAHGRQDSVIPLAEATAAQTALRAAGSQPDLLIEDHLGHAPGPLGMARAAQLLANWSQAQA